MIKSFEDFQSFGKDGVDAYVASATALTKGIQTIAAENVDYSRKVFEKGSEAFEKAASAKSFDKVIEVQQNYAKDAYEAFLGQVNKLGELYLATAKEAYKPFESRVTALTPKAGK